MLLKCYYLYIKHFHRGSGIVNKRNFCIGIIIFIILTGGYIFYHDHTFPDAYVRIDSHSFATPFGSMATKNIIVNDFTYMPKNMSYNGILTLDEKAYPMQAFMVQDMKPTYSISDGLKMNSFQYPHFAIFIITPDIQPLMETANHGQFTYFYKDGTRVIKTIRLKS